MGEMALLVVTAETALVVMRAEMTLVGVMAEVTVIVGVMALVGAMALVGVMALVVVQAETALVVVMVVRLGLRGHATIDLAHAAAQRRWTRRSWQS